MMCRRSQLGSEIKRAKSILDDAIAEHQPVAIYAGFSGGYDSLVSTHFALSYLKQARPLHINTGIGIERTREYVRQVSRDFGWDLREEKTSISYEKWVLANGFPGPAMHGTMYQKLKERPIRRVVAEAKEGRPRSSRVLIISGIRHDESKIRAGYKRAVSRVDSQVWVNPFYFATLDHFREYRQSECLPLNPVKEILGFSGECTCGAHADEGELSVRIRLVDPAHADYLEDLERRVREAGFPWGYEEGPPKWWLQERRGQRFFFDMGRDTKGTACKPGPMCNSCEKVKVMQ